MGSAGSGKRVWNPSRISVPWFTEPIIQSPLRIPNSGTKLRDWVSPRQTDEDLTNGYRMSIKKRAWTFRFALPQEEPSGAPWWGTLKRIPFSLLPGVGGIGEEREPAPGVH